MTEHLALAQLVDGVLLFALLEAVALCAWRRASGTGLPAREVIASLAAGACLMLALRGYARDWNPGWIAMCLLGAGIAHAVDMRLRWRRADAPATTQRRVTA